MYKKRFLYDDFMESDGFRFRIGSGVLEYQAFDMHNHEFAELAIIRGGKAMHRTEDEDHPLEAGDVLVINPNVRHGFREIDRLHLTNIIYDPALFIPAHDLSPLSGYHRLFVIDPVSHQQGSFRNRFRLSPKNLTSIEPLIKQLEQEYEGRKPGYMPAITGLFTQLVTELCRAASAVPTTSRSPQHRLAQVVSNMETHSEEPHRLSTLARKAGLSENQFLRLFKKYYLTSPIDYLIRLRIRKACDLLKHTDKSITEIAFQSGFSDSNYFYRQFRRITGESAREYRRRHLLSL